MKTPEAWRHARIDEIDEDLFAVRSFYLHGRFGPMSLIALGFKADSLPKTEGIELQAALKLGAEIENAIRRSNGQRTLDAPEAEKPNGRKRRK